MKLSNKSTSLCFLSCWCHGAVLVGLRQLGAAGLSANSLSDRLENRKKRKKSLHGFEWRARQRRWSGLVCLGSGHCWGPALSSGGGKSAQVCPSIAECCVKVEGRDWSLAGEVVDCQYAAKYFFSPSLTPRFLSAFHGLLSCRRSGPACRKRTTTLSLTC